MSVISTEFFMSLRPGRISGPYGFEGGPPYSESDCLPKLLARFIVGDVRHKLVALLAEFALGEWEARMPSVITGDELKSLPTPSAIARQFPPDPYSVWHHDLPPDFIKLDEQRLRAAILAHAENMLASDDAGLHSAHRQIASIIRASIPVSV